MKLNKRAKIQITIILSAAIISIIYYFYINDYIHIKILSVADMNPYGGWSAFKSYFTDLSYRWKGISKSIALTIAILITSLLMGRFFCGFICPIGTLQDFFKFIGKKAGIKEYKLPRSKYIKPEILKYFILILVLALSTVGLGNMIAPFSPWVNYQNIFLGFKINLGTLFLILIIILSLSIKRIFCRCFCPLGAFQGLMYAIGPLKISKNNSCKGCSYCFKNCPVDIEKTVDGAVSPECINCMNCTETNCLKKDTGFNIKFANKKLSKNVYIFISLLIFLAIYVLTPMIPRSTEVQLLSNIGDIKDGIYIGQGIGFGGTIFTEVKVVNKSISEIKIVEHDETSGYYEEAFKRISQEIVETQNFNLDAISGATATSRGLSNSIKDAVSKAIDFD